MGLRQDIHIPDESIQEYANRIVVYHGNEPGKTKLTFFADGYPGIMYQETSNGLFVSPQNKELPVFFLYGQTIHPIELYMTGPYKLIAFQLFPDTVLPLLEIKPSEINDGCYDLRQVDYYFSNPIIPDIQKKKNTESQIRIITKFLKGLSETRPLVTEKKIRQAIHLILKSHGICSMKEIRTPLFITERTFERQFKAQVGIGPKQFAKIIRFQHSLSEIKDQDLDKLTDVVYNNGFTDQSHFIRAFKEYTGKTPGQFRSKRD